METTTVERTNCDTFPEEIQVKPFENLNAKGNSNLKLINEEEETSSSTFSRYTERRGALKTPWIWKMQAVGHQTSSVFFKESDLEPKSNAKWINNNIVHMYKDQPWWPSGSFAPRLGDRLSSNPGTKDFTNGTYWLLVWRAASID